MNKNSYATTKKRDSGKTIKRPLVAIAVPSTKLLNQLNEIKTVFDFFQVLSEISIVAAHRSPKKTLRFIDELEHKGVSVIIAAGSGSAHLPGMIASLTTIPVIGVPLRGGTLNNDTNATWCTSGNYGNKFRIQCWHICLSDTSFKVSLSKRKVKGA